MRQLQKRQHQNCRRYQPSSLETMLGGMFDSNFNRIVQEFFNDDFIKPAFFDKHTYPKVNVISYKDRVEIHAGVPGLTEKDVDVRLDSDILVLTGKKQEQHVEDGDVIYHELKQSAFTRAFDVKALVGSYDINDIKASFKDGILTVAIPREQELEDKTKVIEIQRKESTE